MKLFIEAKKCKQGDKTWVGLYADLGYRTVFLTMETATIAEIADLKISELLSLPVGEPYVIGDIKK